MGSMVSLSCESCGFTHEEAQIGIGRISRVESFACYSCKSFVQKWQLNPQYVTEIDPRATEIKKLLGGDDDEQEKSCCTSPNLEELPDPVSDDQYNWPCPSCRAQLTVHNVGLWG